MIESQQLSLCSDDDKAKPYFEEKTVRQMVRRLPRPKGPDEDRPGDQHDLAQGQSQEQGQGHGQAVQQMQVAPPKVNEEHVGEKEVRATWILYCSMIINILRMRKLQEHCGLRRKLKLNSTQVSVVDC